MGTLIVASVIVGVVWWLTRTEDRHDDGRWRD